MGSILKQTLSDQVYELLKKDILTQAIAPGTKLTLKMLQDRLDLSSTPVREAMNRLSQEGLLEHVTHIGAKVIQLTGQDIHELYDVCSLLDVAALGYSYQNGPRTPFCQALEANLTQQKKALATQDMIAFRHHSDGFHDLFFQFANNRRLYEASLRIRNQLSILIYQYQSAHIAETMVYQEHQAIYDALMADQLGLAQQLLEGHLSHGKAMMLDAAKGC